MDHQKREGTVGTAFLEKIGLFYQDEAVAQLWLWTLIFLVHCHDSIAVSDSFSCGCGTLQTYSGQGALAFCLLPPSRAADTQIEDSLIRWQNILI